MGYRYGDSKKPERGDIYFIKPGRKATGNNVIHATRPGIIVNSSKVDDGFRYIVVFMTTTPRSDSVAHCTIRSADLIPS